MGQAVGDSLPLAVAVAVCPLPIIAVVLMLLSRRAGANGWAFLAGWVAGIVVVVSAVAAIAGTADLGSPSAPSTGASWSKVAIGILLLFVGVWDWRRRPKGDEAPALPRWASAIESIRPPKAAGLGILLSAANPKSLLFLVAGGVTIAQGATGAGATAASIVVFTVIASSTVALPVVLTAVLGERARGTLDGMRDWLEANHHAVTAVLLLVIGVLLVGSGIGGF